MYNLHSASQYTQYTLWRSCELVSVVWHFSINPGIVRAGIGFRWRTCRRWASCD